LGYLIGNLDAGGSERQLSELAIGMAAQGHTVEIASYDGKGTFDQYVQDHGVVLHRMSGGSKFRKIRAIRQWMATFQPHILHGFMKRASSLAVLANLPRQRCGIVGSDFSTATYAPYQPALWGALVLFHWADCVVTQTQTNSHSLGRLAPTLKKKIAIVRNGVDDSHFHPGAESEREVFRFLCVGTVWEAKNPVRVVQAVQILRQQTDRPFVFEWVGPFARKTKGGEPLPAYVQARQLIETNGGKDFILFTGPTPNVLEKYQNADALVHASVQDGFPNAVVEGMACGLPIIVSRVSDLPLIVKEGRNGIVCNAYDPYDMAHAMKVMLESKVQDRVSMGQRSRELARNWFGMQRFITDYETIYQKIIEARESKKT